MSLDQRLRQVVADVFGLDAAFVTDDDSPHTIEGWDSVGHLNLVFALEAEFMLRFEAEQIPELISIRAIRDLVTESQSTGE